MRIVQIAAVVTSCALPVLAQQIPADQAHSAFEEAQKLSDADGGRLWGRPLAGPMLFVRPADRALIANQRDAGGRLQPSGDVFVGTLPEEIGVANNAQTWAGVKWTMVMWPLPEARYTRGRLMMHELFHRVQDDLGLPGANPANSHLDSRDGRIWLQMEWRGLSEALIRAGEERRRAVADALAFRAHRRALFPNAATEERALEINEGLAEYTGYRLCGLPESVLPDRVALRLDQQQGGTGFVRNFAYVSGPAYGLLLDAANPDWRKSLTKDNDLGDLLGAAMGVGALAASESEVLVAAARYDGRKLIAAETEREARRQRQLAAYKARFFDGPVLILAASPDVQYTYDPNGVEAYDDAASVYGTVRVTERWGILDVTAGGALLVRREGRIAEVRVPAPASTGSRNMTGEGWTLKLAEGWSIRPGTRPGDFEPALVSGSDR